MRRNTGKESKERQERSGAYKEMTGEKKNRQNCEENMKMERLGRYGRKERGKKNVQITRG